MSPVSRTRKRRGGGRSRQRYRDLVPLGDHGGDIDVVGACEVLISSLDGTLPRRGIDVGRILPVFYGMAALVGTMAEKLGTGPSNPAAYRELLTLVQADNRLYDAFGEQADPDEADPPP